MKYFVIALVSLLLAATSLVAQNSNYRLKSGDTVTVEVLEDQQLNRQLLVLPDGTINFPFAGTVRAGGRTVAQLQQSITQGIAGNFAATPTVFVTVAALRPRIASAPLPPPEPETIEVFFTGEINNPGARTVPPGTTFLQAVALSGGFTRFAATKRVQLRRLGGQVVAINYRAISDGAQLEQDIILQDGDVILVPERRLFE